MSNVRGSQNKLKLIRVWFVMLGNGPATGQKIRERGDTPPPVDAMVAMASTGGMSSPDRGEQWLYRKLCSPPVDGGYSGGVDETSPLKNSHLLMQYLATPSPRIASGMEGND